MIDDEEELTPAQQQVLSKWGVLPGFEMVDKPPHPRLIASVYGQDKSGKTSFALTFPAPIVVMNFDYGLDELFYARPELVGNVFKRSFKITETMVARDLEPILQEFEAAWGPAIEFAGERGGTVVIDPGTILWQVVQDVKVTQTRDERVAQAKKKTYPSEAKRQEAIERAEKPLQLDYGKANLYMAGLLRRVFHFEKLNACFIHKAKPEYNENGRQTGGWEFHGFGETSGITQVHLYSYKQEGQFKARIMRCRYNSSLDGLDLLNPTYETVSGMMGIL